MGRLHDTVDDWILGKKRRFGFLDSLDSLDALDSWILRIPGHASESPENPDVQGV